MASLPVEQQQGQQICLKWNSFHSSLVHSFESLWEEEGLVDVTLSSDGQTIKAHKVVLSACSPYFRSLFQNNPCQHPVIILQGVRYSELESLMCFVYKGEVNISQDNLPELLRAADTLHIRGLSGASEQVKEKMGGKHPHSSRTSDSPLPKRARSSHFTPNPHPAHQPQPSHLSHPPHSYPSPSTSFPKSPQENKSSGNPSQEVKNEPEEEFDCYEESESGDGKGREERREEEDDDDDEMHVVDESDGAAVSGLGLEGFRRGAFDGRAAHGRLSPSDPHPKVKFDGSLLHGEGNLDSSSAATSTKSFPYPPFPCPFCDRAYTSWGFRRRHIKAVHTQSPRLSCKWCLQVLPTHEEWEKHVTAEHALSRSDAHNGLLILEEAHMVLQIPNPTRLDTFVDMIKKTEEREREEKEKGGGGDGNKGGGGDNKKGGGGASASGDK